MPSAAPAQLGQEAAHQLGRHRGLVAGRRPEHGEQLLGVQVLEQVAVHAHADGPEQPLVVVADRQHDHLDAGELLEDHLGGLDARHDRHLHVHDHQVGLQPSRLLDALEAVVGLADDLQVRLGVDQRRDRAAEQRGVVDEQHPGGARGRGVGGVRHTDIPEG